MLTNFSVQASVSEFYTAQRLLKEPPAKALPQVGCSRGVRGGCRKSGNAARALTVGSLPRFGPAPDTSPLLPLLAP
jgi:hypothetical protein